MSGPSLPHFLIAGTQKGGTTWLEHQLAGRGDVFTPRRQLHFFDRHFDKGVDWYAAQFTGAGPDQVRGEKTTEYLDTIHDQTVAERIARTLPEGRVIVILRDPVKRATSALQHMVNSGLEALPADPDALLFADMERPAGQGWRYIERGFYARQLEALYAHVPRDRVLVLIFEDDIITDPQSCWARVCDFLGLAPAPPRDDLDQAVNVLRLSAPAIRLSRLFYSVPYARGLIRRLDRMLGLTPWRPRFSDATLQRLRTLYAPHNQALFEMLGRPVPAWQGG